MVAIELLIMDNDGNFALVKKNNGWALPGGYLGLNESFNQAGQRIIKKQLGEKVKLTRIEFLKVFNLPEKVHGQGQGHAVVLVFKYREMKKTNSVHYFKNIPRDTLKHHKAMITEILK